MNKIFFKRTEKLFFIGSAIVFSKIIFLIIPYLISDVQYNNFNKYYYSAAIIILVAKLGFEFAINRIKISHAKLFTSIFVNTILLTLLLSFLDSSDYSFQIYLSIFFYALFYILANIFLIKNLFEGAYKKYFLFKVTYGLVLLTTVFGLFQLNMELYLVFPIAGVLWFLFVYAFNSKDRTGDGSTKDFYRLGFSAFIINAALGFTFIADKYIINHFFDVETANAYTFAWALTAPMLYIGTTIEHTIFSAGDSNKRKKINLSVLILFGLVFIYSAAIFFAISYFPNLLPVTIDSNLLKTIILYFLVIYSIYTVVQYPLNGLLFKFIDDRAQLTLAKIYPIAFLVFLTILYFLFIYNESQNYLYLIIICASYLFSLLFLKTLSIKRDLSLSK